jgi:hypothetical protein
MASGAGTLSYLDAPSDAGTASALPTVSPADRDMWVRTVIGEANGDPSAPGVAHVIANRMRQNKASATDTVLAPDQFEPWASRQQELMSYKPADPAYKSAAKIVDGVISGKISDPTNGATQFYAPVAQKALGRAPPKWDDGTGQQIGGHLFFGGKQTPLSDDEISASWGGPRTADKTLADQEIDALWAGPKAATQGSQPNTTGAVGDMGLRWGPDGGRDPKTNELVIAGKPFAQQPTSQALAATTGVLSGVPVVGPSLVSGVQHGAAAANALMGGAPYEPSLAGFQDVTNASAQEYPKTTAASNIAGSLLGTSAGMVAAPAAFGVGVANPLAAAALSGGTGAGLSAADVAARGGNAEDVKNSALWGGGLGAAAPLIGQGVAAFGRGVGNATIGTLPEETAQLAERARAMGIPVNTGQMSESPGVRFTSSALNKLPFSGAGADTAAIQAGVNRNVAKTIGEDAEKLTPKVMNTARLRIGGYFDTVANSTDLNADAALMTDIHAALNEAGLVISKGEYEPLIHNVQNILDKVDRNTGKISGAQYQALTKTNSPLDKLTDSENSNVSFYANKIKSALDEALSRSAPPEMQDLLTTAKRQWASLKTIQPLVAKAPTGDISSSLLAGAVNRQTGNGMAFGRGGDLGEIARIGQKFLKEPPSSGTAERSLVYNALSGGAGAGGVASYLANPDVFHNPALLTGLATGVGVAGLGRGMGSALRSNWMANQLLNRSLRAAPLSTTPTAGVSNALVRQGVPLNQQRVNALAR